MSIGELDPTTIKPFSRIHYHNGFDAFGFHLPALGDGGYTNNQLANGQPEPLPDNQVVLHEDGKAKHEKGAIIPLRFFKERFEIINLKSLPREDHAECMGCCDERIESTGSIKIFTRTCG